MTDDVYALRQLLRLRGLGLMADLLEEYPEDNELVICVLSSVEQWPLMNRIKIEDVGFEEKIKPYTTSDDDELRQLATRILESWDKLEQGYRIPRKRDDDDDVPTMHITLDDASDRPKKRPRIAEVESFTLPPSVPVPVATPMYRRPSGPMPWEMMPITPRAPQEPTKEQLDAIIARAAATAAAMAAPPPPPPDSPVKKSSGKVKSDAQKAALKEKQLKKLIGGVVVKAASKYAKQMGKDTFKRFAEEVCPGIQPLRQMTY